MQINFSVSDGSWAFLTLYMNIHIALSHEILKIITCIVPRNQMFSFQYKKVLLQPEVWNVEFLGAVQVSSYHCHGLFVLLQRTELLKDVAG